MQTFTSGFLRPRAISNDDNSVIIDKNVILDVPITESKIPNDINFQLRCCVHVTVLNVGTNYV